jgi:hypothetical protein
MATMSSLVSLRASSASSRHPQPEASPVAISAPMLVPMKAPTSMPASCSAFHTPMWATPFIPPPPSTSTVPPTWRVKRKADFC